MKWIIAFRGEIPNEIVSENFGKKLYEDWLADELPSRIEIRKGHAILSSQIKFIREYLDGRDVISEKKAEWEDYCKEVQAAPIKERAKRLNKFTLYYYMQHNRNNPSKEVLEKAEKIQSEYYKWHPHAVAVPISEFKEYLTDRSEVIAKESAKLYAQGKVFSD